MRKKIAITTLVGCLNFGNKLQMYALQQLLKNNFDVDVYTFSHDSFLISNKRKLSLAKKVIDKLRTKKSLKERRREKNFAYFDKFISFDNNEYTRDDVNSLNKKYDFFIAGSDQVWNDEMNLNIKNHVLSNIDKNKKISFSASLGKTELTSYEKALFKKYLSQFKAISVREKQSVKTLEEIINNKIDWHIDPTFYVSPDEWKLLERKPKQKLNDNFILVCLLGENYLKYNEFINKLSKKYNLKIVNIWDKHSKFYDIGPSEFLYCIQRAKLVLTDSFHTIVFSILFKKPFLHLSRIDKLSDMSIRVKSLEELFSVKFDTPNDFIEENLFKFKIKDVDKVLQKEKKRALEYLKHALCDTLTFNSLKDKDFDCSGCGACAYICPKKAISYSTNEKGFIQPIIDETKCVHCGLCVKNCVELKRFEQLKFDNGIFAYKINDRNEVKNSSTIGLVHALALKTIRSGGVVFGVAYNKSNNKFIKVDNEIDLGKLRGSKYYQADVTVIYKEIKYLLNSGVQVMVCGTPCQITGLSSQFGQYNNLLLIQLICHGVPAYSLFQQVEKEYYGDIPDSVNFKLHNPSWDNYSVEYTFGEDKKIILAKDEPWMNIFLSDIALNDCCYNCNYAGKKTGADIIVGDCWGIKNINKNFYDKAGVSIVVPCSTKGNNRLKEISNNFKIYKIPKSHYNKCNVNLFKCIVDNNVEKFQFEFFESLKDNSAKKSYEKLNLNSKKEKDLTFKQRIKRKIKNIIKKILRY